MLEKELQCITAIVAPAVAKSFAHQVQERFPEYHISYMLLQDIAMIDIQGEELSRELTLYLEKSKIVDNFSQYEKVIIVHG